MKTETRYINLKSFFFIYHELFHLTWIRHFCLAILTLWAWYWDGYETCIDFTNGNFWAWSGNISLQSRMNHDRWIVQERLFRMRFPSDPAQNRSSLNAIDTWCFFSSWDTTPFPIQWLRTVLSTSIQSFSIEIHGKRRGVCLENVSDSAAI